jgi:hypothetical protein
VICHFAQGKACLGNVNRPTNGFFFSCAIFTLLELFHNWNFPPPHKTRLGQVFIWPTHALFKDAEAGTLFPLSKNIVFEKNYLKI